MSSLCSSVVNRHAVPEAPTSSASTDENIGKLSESNVMLVKNKTGDRGSTVAQVTGSATLVTAGIPFIDLVTGRTFIGNGQPTTFDVVGYQSATTTGTVTGFVLTDASL